MRKQEVRPFFTFIFGMKNDTKLFVVKQFTHGHLFIGKYNLHIFYITFFVSWGDVSRGRTFCATGRFV